MEDFRNSGFKTSSINHPFGCRCGAGHIARAVDLPLFGFGDDALEAINALKDEIESLYNDLMEDDKFSEEWLRYKRFLKEIVVPSYLLPCHIQT